MSPFSRPKNSTCTRVCTVRNLFNFNEQGIKKKFKNVIFLSNDRQNILKEYSHVLKNEIVLTFVSCFLHAQTEIQQYFEVNILSHNINCSDFIVKQI